MRAVPTRVLVATHTNGTRTLSEALPDDDSKALEKIRNWAGRVPKPSTWIVRHAALREATQEQP